MKKKLQSQIICHGPSGGTARLFLFSDGSTKSTGEKHCIELALDLIGNHPSAKIAFKEWERQTA